MERKAMTDRVSFYYKLLSDPSKKVEIGLIYGTPQELIDSIHTGEMIPGRVQSQYLRDYQIVYGNIQEASELDKATVTDVAVLHNAFADALSGRPDKQLAQRIGNHLANLVKEPGLVREILNIDNAEQLAQELGKTLR